MPKKLSDFDKFQMELMQNPEFLAEYQRTKPFADIAVQIIKARNEAGLTQKELACRIGTAQSVISRIESFDYEGTKLGTLLRVAEALGKDLEVNFKEKTPA